MEMNMLPVLFLLLYYLYKIQGCILSIIYKYNVWFFAPEDDPVAVRKELEMLWERQEANQFGDARYAVYFFQRNTMI